jgi:hypothetical protein
MRSRPCATWTWLPLSAALLAVGCGAGSWEELATPTPRATKSTPTTTLVSTDGKTFTPGEARHTDPTPSTFYWTHVTVDDGRLVLHVGEDSTCTTVKHVEVGPPDGDFRRVAVETDGDLPADCDREARELVLDLGAPVDEDTIVTPREILVPDPRFTRQRSLAGGGGVLQADRRTIVTNFSYGTCEALAATKAKVEGRTIIVAVVTGADPGMPVGTTCGASSQYGTTLTRLPRPAPKDAKIIAAWCLPGPGCSI